MFNNNGFFEIKTNQRIIFIPFNENNLLIQPELKPTVAPSEPPGGYANKSLVPTNKPTSLPSGSVNSNHPTLKPNNARTFQPSPGKTSRPSNTYREILPSTSPKEPLIFNKNVTKTDPNKSYIVNPESLKGINYGYISVSPGAHIEFTPGNYQNVNLVFRNITQNSYSNFIYLPVARKNLNTKFWLSQSKDDDNKQNLRKSYKILEKLENNQSSHSFLMQEDYPACIAKADKFPEIILAKTPCTAIDSIIETIQDAHHINSENKRLDYTIPVLVGLVGIGIISAVALFLYKAKIEIASNSKARGDQIAPEAYKSSVLSIDAMMEPRNIILQHEEFNRILSNVLLFKKDLRSQVKGVIGLIEHNRPSHKYFLSSTSSIKNLIEFYPLVKSFSDKALFSINATNTLPEIGNTMLVTAHMGLGHLSAALSSKADSNMPYIASFASSAGFGARLALSDYIKEFREELTAKVQTISSYEAIKHCASVVLSYTLPDLFICAAAKAAMPTYQCDKLNLWNKFSFAGSECYSIYKASQEPTVEDTITPLVIDTAVAIASYANGNGIFETITNVVAADWIGRAMFDFLQSE